MKLVVYGPGCFNCQKLEQNVINALAKLDVPAEVEKCTDLSKFSPAGIWRTPGLSIDGEVVSQGKILSSSNIEELIKARLG